MSVLSIDQALALAVRHHQAGQLRQAEAVCRQVLQQQPNHPAALHLLGLLAHQVGRHDIAADLIRQAIAVDASQPAFHNNLGTALQAQGQLREAEACYRRSIALASRDAHARNNLGSVLLLQNRLDEAVEQLRQAVALAPDHAAAHQNLADALSDQRFLPQAIEHYRKAIALQRNYAAYYNLANALRDMQQTDEAIVSYHRAIELKPDLAEAHDNLGSILKDQGWLDAAVACYRQAIELTPDHSPTYSNLLFALQFHPHTTAESLRVEHERWAARHARPLFTQIWPHSNDRSPDRPLRIGYVSPNLRRHVIGLLMEAVLANHDHTQFQVICYSDALQHDDHSRLLMSYSDLWRNTAALADEQLAQQVREDQIDILVDLNLHMAQNRMLVFARKPAPVQVTYLGYPASTGLKTMDYRLTDRYLNPDVGSAPRTSEIGGSSQHSVVSSQHASSHATDYCLLTTDYSSPEGPEKLIYLPDCYWCYTAYKGAPPVNDLPALHSGRVVFSCFNKFTKINSGVIEVWCRLLKGLPQAELWLLIAGGQRNEHIWQAFEAHGIARNRVRLIGRLSPAEYLRLHHEVDIALDPFPYTGHTTSYDALYMGIPVVTLAGNRAVARAGVSILFNLGLTDLIAHTPEQYIRIATALAQDLPRLSELRKTLRDRMKNSPLMDGKRFTQGLEAAYRQMWHTWCQA